MRRLLLLLLLPVLLAAGCGREQPAAPPPVRGALLVTVEGALPDFSAEGFAFRSEDVSPVSPEVLPSAASVLTGRIPPWHGLRVDGVGALDPATPTLATRFRDKGHECAAFLSDIALSSVHGLANGFSAYSVAIAPTNRATRFHRTSAEVCAECGASWSYVFESAGRAYAVGGGAGFAFHIWANGHVGFKVVRLNSRIKKSIRQLRMLLFL